MGDYYQYFLSSMSGVGLYQVQGPQHIPPVLPCQDIPLSIRGSLATETQSPGVFSGSKHMAVHDALKPESQKKSMGGAPGSETVKYRRTRSGCFTCRSRRVKVGNACASIRSSLTFNSAMNKDLFVSVSIKLSLFSRFSVILTDIRLPEGKPGMCIPRSTSTERWYWAVAK